MTKEEAKSLVNDFKGISLQIMYGYYGGDLSETSTDKMREHIINSLFEKKEDSALVLTVKTLESKFDDENDNDNGWKLFGVFLNRENFNLFCDIHGGKSCEFLCKLNKGVDKINDFIDGFDTVITLMKDAEKIYNSAETLLAENRYTKEYTKELVDGLKNTLDFSSDIFGTLFKEYDTCLSVLNNVCQYTIDSFIEISEKHLNQIRLTELSTKLEIVFPGEYNPEEIFKLMYENYKKENESDYDNSNDFIKHIRDCSH